MRYITRFLSKWPHSGHITIMDLHKDLDSVKVYCDNIFRSDPAVHSISVYEVGREFTASKPIPEINIIEKDVK